jgi:hypothetical protein
MSTLVGPARYLYFGASALDYSIFSHGQSGRSWMTLVLYGDAPSQEAWGETERWRARSIKPSEGSRSRVRRTRVAMGIQ